MLECSRVEQLEVLEELALLRDACGSVVEMYAWARETHAQKNNETSAELVLRTGLMMREALNEVISAVAIAKKSDSLSKKSMSPAQFNFVIAELSQTIGESFDHANPTEVQIFEKVSAQLNKYFLASENDLQESGTATSFVSSPSDDVLEMDSTVPKLAEGA
jgi:hypothetical protein